MTVRHAGPADADAGMIELQCGSQHNSGPHNVGC